MTSLRNVIAHVNALLGTNLFEFSVYFFLKDLNNMK